MREVDRWEERGSAASAIIVSGGSYGLRSESHYRQFVHDYMDLAMDDAMRLWQRLSWIGPYEERDMIRRLALTLGLLLLNGGCAHNSAAQAPHGAGLVRLDEAQITAMIIGKDIALDDRRLEITVTEPIVERFDPSGAYIRRGNQGSVIGSYVIQQDRVCYQASGIREQCLSFFMDNEGQLYVLEQASNTYNPIIVD